MKLSIAIQAALIALATHLGAFDIPSGVFAYDELETAKVEALEDEEALIFLFSDPRLKPT